MRKFYRNMSVICSTGLVAISMALTSTPVLSSGSGPVTAYQHVNFRGRSLSVGEGEQSIRDIRRSVGNDRISSFSIDAGYSVYACEHGGFRGDCLTFTNDTRDLRYINFNDVISSFRVERTAPEPVLPVTVYQHVNFRGDSYSVGEGEHSIGDIRRSDVGNDRISSIAIQPGYSVYACEHSRFRGTCHTFTSDTADLRTIHFNDKISSFRVDAPGSDDSSTDEPITVTVTDVTGGSVDDAAAALSPLGVNIIERANIAPAGTVLSQSEASGTIADLSITIDLEVSSGPPNVVGLEQDEAIDEIVAAGIDGELISVITEFNGVVPIGNVVSQDITDGTAVLTVSQGPEPLVIPNLFLATLVDALEAFEVLSFFTVNVIEVPSIEAAGEIIGQSVAGGTSAIPGSVIDLEVSSGVPNVVGLPRSTAISTLININAVSYTHLTLPTILLV